MSGDEVTYEPDPAAIAADLADDGVHVDPAVAEWITPEQLSAVTSLVDGADPTVFVLAVPLNYDSDLSANQLVTLVHRELQRDGVYFVGRQSGADRWQVDATSYNTSTDNEDALATYVARDRFPSDLGEQLRETVDVFTSGEARTEYEEQFPERQETVTSTGDGSSQVLGMDPPVAIGVGVALAVVVAVVVLRRRRPRGEVVLKRRALQRISSAQTREWRRRAETETAALGERIRELEIEHGDDGATWAAALDHYQAATAILDRSDDAADAIGALVLARRGDDALSHAADGRSWTPTAACFFNPLHGPATTKAPWRTPAGTRDVPCCGACRRDIGKRREPEILDLPTGDTVVHYMDAGVEPWASTGFGALAPDLLDRLGERP
ncbi:hypothetical protein [Jiangella rhizosphaerae]|uniref:Uncharacterized protein n=1 Tax=Jiangella rhizosphaerae TaxID=2293569 RepID=A0A418KH44_9ACTN|nr:hypothetical protein [Jiangella rhizosphaerae]RIQ11445.1 hypothetical protein DY240_28640 [Jiangella rhizosphaerae]